MKILHVSDIHDNVFVYWKVTELVKQNNPDILAITGDFCTSGLDTKEYKEFIKFLKDVLKVLPKERILFVPGNHDRAFDSEHFKSIIDYLAKNSMQVNQRNIDKTYQYVDEIKSLCTVLIDEEYHIDDTLFYGFPWCPVFHNWAFNIPEEEIYNKSKFIPDEVDVLLTHSPPYMILDKTSSGLHAGSKGLQKRLTEISPKAVLFGHIHENGFTTYTEHGIIYKNGSLLNHYNIPSEKLLGDQCYESYLSIQI